ncbi:MAG: PDZ domain-containing protein, partial [Actinobacteria bacterium]|nr:PDZ domain-containing protein [Actinomycetota bacterium]
IVVVLIVLSITIRFPKVIISPGSANSTQKAVTITGAPTTPINGAVYFLTVRVTNNRPNVWRLGYAWIEGDSEIVDEDKFLGGLSRKQSDQLDTADMSISQETATVVALEKLGYTVPITGATVAAVDPKGPANGKLQAGDVIVSIDGAAITSPETVGQAVRSKSPGSTVVFTVERNGKRLDEAIITYDAGQGKARVGIVTSPRYSFPISVKIDSGDVSGPSAGLAFTITIIDELTTGQLTGGKKVAITGTIGPDGQVGPVGGVPQKAVTARDAGASIMIVPADEVGEANKHAGAMKVVGVRTLDEALAALVANGGDPLPEIKPKAA